ncbi:MAG: hypothetical protein HY692_03975, partial [Cyanobacteria bacterium NC_groundwater_1444_Ag_S-0.65um_54_12]|nr:hypothetical protein [Cyanobacteria bacterium NC_groundwater_1444_Ag_S-0.65um_54_12]
LGIARQKIQICLWARKSDLDVATIGRILGRQVNWQLPWLPQEAHAAINDGVPLVLQQPCGVLARRLDGLAKALFPAARSCAKAVASPWEQFWAGPASWLARSRSADG